MFPGVIVIKRNVDCSPRLLAPSVLRQPSLWYREIFIILPMERLTAVVRGDSAMFEEMWGSVLEHLPTSLQEIIFKGKFVFE